MCLLTWYKLNYLLFLYLIYRVSPKKLFKFKSKFLDILYLHVVLVSDGADAEEEEAGGHHLVQDSPLECEVVTGECSEDCCCVRSDSVSTSVMLIPL